MFIPDVNYKDATDYGALLVENTEIKNFCEGITCGNVVGTIESITFSKCLIHDIQCDGGDSSISVRTT